MSYRIALVLLFLVAPVASEPSSTEIVLMATSDVHCRLCPDSSGAGLAAIATVVGELRAHMPASALLDVGDAFEGCPEADYYATVDTVSPHPLAKMMNRLGYEAMALGNHEFTYGMTLLKRVAGQVSFPMLAANVTAPSPVWRSHTVLQVGPARVLVVGVTTPWTALAEGPWLEDVRFEDPVETLRRLLPVLRKQEKPDLVCVLAHTGLGDGSTPGAENAGRAIAERVAGIDVLFLGHTHTTVHETVGSTLVLQPGVRGSAVAVATFTLARKGSGYAVTGREGSVLATAQPDSSLLLLCRQAEEPVRQWLDEPVGTLDTALTAGHGTHRLDEITRLIGEVMIAQGRGHAAFVPLASQRLVLPAGPVYRRDLYRLQPYLNRLVTVRLSAGDIRACLEEAAATWAPYPFDGSTRVAVAEGKRYDLFLAGTGLSYALDYTEPAGSRLRWVRRQGRPLPDSLDVVVTSYHRTGPGGYADLLTAPEIRRTDRYLRDLLADRFAAEASSPSRQETWWSLPSYRGHWAHSALDMFLARSGHKGLAGIDWLGYPSPEAALALVGAAWGGDVPPSLATLLSTHPITRGDLLVPLVRELPVPLCTFGSASDRFADIAPRTEASLWDSVVSSGLVAGLPGDSLLPDAAVSTADLVAFCLNARYRALTVVSSNDFHGHLERNPTRGHAGMEGMAAWVARARKANPEGVILLDAGDAMQGTPISNLFFGSSTIRLYRRLGYDALAVGNHEFDWGQSVLQDRIAEAGFPFLGANVLVEGTESPPEWLQPFTVVERGGARVAIMGFGTPETPWATLPDHVAGLHFEDPAMVFDRLLPAVHATDPDLIVVLAHLGLEEIEHELVGGAAVLTDAAAGKAHVLFNGHTHQTYARRIHGLPHLQGGSHGRACCVARAWLDRLGPDEPWVVPSVERLDLPGLRDPECAEAVETYRLELAPRTEVVVTQLAHPISRERNEAGESAMGRLIAESQRWMTGTQIAIMNTGGVRSDVDAGPVTWQALFTVQPFGNTLVKTTLTGKELLTTLEQGIHPDGTRLQLAGIEAWITLARSFGQRVVRAHLEDGTPINPEADYTVVVNNFMASGGDGFTVLRDASRKYDTGIVDVDAMIAYLKTMPQPVTVELPPRLRLAK
ncbi:5'-nucleotidase C-terminal domain-containing protein [Candidatus Fermentibacteria bacterium]|nr:5'-nucleotidase C-terminal domain-containing protein [Candidatus Fermentibacteria bacterium]